MTTQNKELITFFHAGIDRMAESTELAFTLGLGAGAVAACGAYLLGNAFIKLASKTNPDLLSKLKLAEPAETHKCDTLHSVVGTWSNKKTHKFPLRKIDISIKRSKRVMEVLNHTDALDFATLTKYCTQGFAIHHKSSTNVMFIGMTDLSDTPLEFSLLMDSCSELFNGRWLLSSIPLENQYGKFTPKENELLVSSMLESNVYDEDYIPSLWESLTREEANIYFQEIVYLAANHIEDEYNKFKLSVESKAEQQAAIESKKQTWGFKQA